MKIKGIDGLTLQEIDAELAVGGRFVFYEYCISIVFLTLRRPTSIQFLRAGDRGMLRSLPYVIVSLIFGWWGIPWGLVYTPMAIFSNLGGGRDVTRDVKRFLQMSHPLEDSTEVTGEM